MNNSTMNVNTLSDINILYVEDEEIARTFSVKALSHVSKLCEEAEDGIVGLEKFKTRFEDPNLENFDIVITDINMPNMNGIKMCEEILKIDSAVPMIIVSAHEELNFLSQAINMGIRGYTIKPINLSKLLNDIHIAVEPNILKKELESKVRERTLELQKSMDIISNHVIYSKTNLKGIITEVSNAFCDIAGYSKDELIGQPHNIVRHPDMNSDIFKDMWSSIRDGKTWHAEIQNLNKNNDTYWVMATVSPEYDENNEIKGYISTREDITDKKNLYELNNTLQEKVNEEVLKNKAQQEKLFEDSKLSSMGEMIGNIAHQWRQPLSVISTIASGIQMKYEYELEQSNEKTLEGMKKIIEKTKYLSETIDTFRDFIKEEKEIKEVILQDRINISLNIATTTLESQNIQLVNNINYDNPIKITMVIGELSQVIINIFNNASDILVEREIQTPIIELDLIQEDNKAIITIEDNAGGIPEDVMPKIFEPYFTTKHQSQGTGLGLHMSHQIITDSLKGKLYAQNTDKGAKFFIELPLD